MRRILFTAILMASPFAMAKGPDIDKVNGSIRTEAQGQYGTLETVNGSVDVSRGVHADSASTVNGRIDIDDDAVLGAVETVNGSIDLGAGVTVERDVSTVNGAIEIEKGSRVFGKLETVNGAVDLDATEVDGRIETVNGDITVGANSIVRGGILVEKPKGNWFWGNGSKPKPPRIVIGPNAVVEGTLDFEREVELYVHSSAKIGTVRGATAKSFSGATP